MTAIKSRPTKKQRRQRLHETGRYDGVLFVSSNDAPDFKLTRFVVKSRSKYDSSGRLLDGKTVGKQPLSKLPVFNVTDFAKQAHEANKYEPVHRGFGLNKIERERRRQLTSANNPT
jgi:hypothetical protein